MESASGALVGLAASIGLVHTIIGVDHTLPFIMLARAQKWSLARLLSITFLCGTGHVLFSVLLGLLGISTGVGIDRLEIIEARRGQMAAWLLIGFGLAYAIWSLHRERKKRSSLHLEPDLPSQRQRRRLATVWGLFIVAVLGPCEPLIPVLMAPAFDQMWSTVVVVVLIFGLVTVGTMCLLVTIGYFGLKLPVFSFLERHVHTASGLAIAGSGLAIQLLGV